jgi:putative SOS response-associated peptidase YedK
VPFFGPRYNIAPTQLAPVIYHERHQPAVKLMRWGLIPSWAKDESVGNAHINARSEREAKRRPFRGTLKSTEPFCFAGLWERRTKPL